MSVGKKVIDSQKDDVNNARETKESMILLVESYSRIQNKLKEMDRIAKEQLLKKPLNEFHFDNSFDKSVQTIIMRNKEEQERN